MDLYIDLETYSPEPIAKAGLYRYAQHPEFEILLFGYAEDDGPVSVVDLTNGERIPARIQVSLGNSNVTKHAFNAAFEWYCLSRYLKLTERGASEWLTQWRDTQLQTAYCGYPLSLDAAGKALGLDTDKQKMAAGRALIRYFCVPCKPTQTNGNRIRNLPKHDPGRWELFKEYNARDVEAEREISHRLSGFPVPEDVQRQWVLDQRINLRGVAADLELMDGALVCGETARATLLEEAKAISGLTNPNSTAQLIKWLEEETGEAPENLRKDTVKDLLSKGVPSEAASRMLEIRQELSKTSTKKYAALESCVCADGRVRGLMAFYGANRTGRESSRLVQLQNLPHDTVRCESFARELVKNRQTDALRICYGSIPHALAALIRTVFIAPPGSVFIDADFSAIEARVLAWLAGEKWVLDVFRSHGKIYEAAASQMFGIPIERIAKGNPEYAYRAKGKVATLALGYQGGPKALESMGALRSGLTEEELPDIVRRWRQSNPAIVQFWYDIEQAALDAVINGKATSLGPITIYRKADIRNDLDFMVIRLPSGRELYYANPHIGANRYGRQSVCYMGQSGKGGKWGPMETYGGKLTENITQAVARDCLFYAMENLTRAGFRIVFDIHDEVVIEALKPELNAVTEIMSRSPPWAEDLPLAADGWTGSYFRKD